MEKDAILHFRIAAKQKEKIEARAEKQAVTMPQCVRDAIDFYLSFDPSFLERIKNSSRYFGVQEFIFLQNISLSWLAEKEARLKVYGLGPHSLLKEFPLTNSGILTGESLYSMLEAFFEHQFINERRNLLMAKMGPLSPEDQAWLNKNSPPPPDVSKEYALKEGEETEITFEHGKES